MELTHLTDSEQKQLKNIAKKAIKFGLDHHQIMPVVIDGHSESLQQDIASFVTINKGDSLRGCIGSLRPHRPLVADIAANAFAACFNDPRFPPLTKPELPFLSIHLSILSEPEELIFDSEDELLRQLKPHIDGLILIDGPHRGTFLPAVWDSLPDPQSFFYHLKMKAGLPTTYWSDTLQVHRYHTLLIE